MTISIASEKIKKKIGYTFMIKTLIQLGIEGNFLNLIKGHLQKIQASIIFHNERPDAFPLRLGTRQGCPLLPLPHCSGDSTQGS